MKKMYTTCCFIGHRKIETTPELVGRLDKTIENLIAEGVHTFLFGGKGAFDRLALERVTAAKSLHSDLSRVYVRAEEPVITDSYRDYLLKIYDETFFPEKLKNAGRAVYVERNSLMIGKSDVCVFFYNENYTPETKVLSTLGHVKIMSSSKSGTGLAYAESVRQGKTIINLA